MTTVVDPSGTPVPVYNRSGTTIVTVNGGPTVSSTAGSAIGDDGTPIPSVSQTTIVLAVSAPYDGHHNIVFRLPADAEIGDVVEVYRFSGENPVVFPNAGEAIGSLAASTGTNTGVGVSAASASFRKISSTQWMPLVGGQ